MMSRPKHATDAKPMEVERNQDTVNYTIPIIDALKSDRKQKKRWRPDQLGVKKGSENYYLSLDNDYSPIRSATGLRDETENFLKDTGVNMVRLVEALGVGPNQANKTYQKLYVREAYNSKSAAALEKNHSGKRKSAEENE